MRFWFYFIYPHTSLIAQAGPQRAAAQVIQPGLEAYFGACFETLCREALPVIYEKEKVSAAFEIGSYWDKQVQIDLVGLRQDGRIDLGECKWGATASPASAAAELEQKIPRYPNTGQATIGRRVFLRSLKQGKQRQTDVRVHTLQELYA